jgi:hypothetical protein
MLLKDWHSLPISFARPHRHLGGVVAGGETVDARGQLAQRRRERTRKPGADQQHQRQRRRPDDLKVEPQPRDRRQGLCGIDLGDQHPVDAGNMERPPGSERRDTAVSDHLAGTLDARKSGSDSDVVDLLLQHRRAIAPDGVDPLGRHAGRLQ